MPRSRHASFALNLPLYRVFDYQLPEHTQAQAGARFRLPFGSTSKIGILLNHDSQQDIDAEKIREVTELIDGESVLSPHLLDLAQWIADYYWQPLGDVLFQTLPTYLRSGKPQQDVRVRRWLSLAADEAALEKLKKKAPRQFELYSAMSENDGKTESELRNINPGWRALAESLKKKGLVEEMLEKPVVDISATSDGPVLTTEQRQVLNDIEDQQDGFAVHVIDGVTGSGKTEIYLRLIENQLREGRQVIYLVPEIGLTTQLVERVQARFANHAVVSHSGLPEGQRYQAWERFRQGLSPIMLGTRSSLFAQNENLGLIIVDEEHDHSYRQDDGVRYQARDVAIKRAQMLDIPILLGSATPSLETLSNRQREHYFYHRLLQRPAGFNPPAVSIIDTQNTVDASGCSEQMLSRAKDHLDAGGQVLIYLNRRGFAPLIMCHQCGWQAECENCDSRLTLHHSVQRLLCHHCGHRQMVPTVCPSCGDADIRHYGSGTEQLERTLGERFPSIPIIRIDRDVVQNHQAMQDRLKQLQSGEPCFLIGTQMITKGHDYPGITLSVIIDADQALFSASYRATEQLAQTVFQVSGRAGRGDRKGEALLQTRFPQHPFLQLLLQGDYQLVAKNLLEERQLLGFPPFSRVIMFRADATRLNDAMKLLEEIKRYIVNSAAQHGVQLIGPMPALMTRRIGRYRAQLCLVGKDFRALRSVLRENATRLQAVRKSARLSWTIDVDAPDL